MAHPYPLCLCSLSPALSNTQGHVAPAPECVAAGEMMCKFAEKNQREQSGSVHHLEAGKELSELREERQEDKADEVGL